MEFLKMLNDNVGVVVGIITSGTAIFVAIKQTTKYIKTTLGDMIDQKFEKLSERLDSFAPVIESIQKEFNNNSGSTIKDILENTSDLVAYNALRFKFFLDSDSTPVFETDAKGHCTYVNDAFCDLTGLDSQRVYGTGWIIALHPEDREKFYDSWQTSLKFQVPIKHEYRFLNDKTLDVRLVRVQIIPVHNTKNELIGFHGVTKPVNNDAKVAPRPARQ